MNIYGCITQRKLERFNTREYATLCGSIRGEYAAVYGIAMKSMRQYADFQSENMRQYADHGVPYTRQPAFLALCFQRDRLILLMVEIE